MKFFIHAIGKGGRSAGCDYSLSCNEETIEIETKTKEEAIAYIQRESTKGRYEGDLASLLDCDKITLFCCEDVQELPIKEWRDKFLAEERKQQEEEALIKAKQKYERLLAKAKSRK